MVAIFILKAYYITLFPNNPIYFHKLFNKLSIHSIFATSPLCSHIFTSVFVLSIDQRSKLFWYNYKIRLNLCPKSFPQRMDRHFMDQTRFVCKFFKLVEHFVGVLKQIFCLHLREGDLPLSLKIIPNLDAKERNIFWYQEFSCHCLTS